jgi:hypothetical protein
MSWFSGLVRQATGSPTVSDAEKPDASFVLIDVQGSKLVTYSYVLPGGADEDTVRAWR